MGHEVGFLPSDKHESFLQVDSITLSVGSQACAKYPIITKCLILDVAAVLDPPLTSLPCLKDPDKHFASR